MQTITRKIDRIRVKEVKTTRALNQTKEVIPCKWDEFFTERDQIGKRTLKVSVEIKIWTLKIDWKVQSHSRT